ncbi:uncharacterized protein [Ptychodera flava]|uniref:uncharacterized protein n=1 Tax=Ptychodera flava TaxID=63121 RepID=UPI00396A9812
MPTTNGPAHGNGESDGIPSLVLFALMGVICLICVTAIALFIAFVCLWNKRRQAKEKAASPETPLQSSERKTTNAEAATENEQTSTLSNNANEVSKEPVNEGENTSERTGENKKIDEVAKEKDGTNSVAATNTEEGEKNNDVSEQVEKVAAKDTAEQETVPPKEGQSTTEGPVADNEVEVQGKEDKNNGVKSKEKSVTYTEIKTENASKS